MSRVVEFTDINFEEKVLNSHQSILVHFYATWSGPDSIVLSFLDELAQDFDGKAIVGKVNIDENQALASQYSIRSIPAVFFIKYGDVVDKQIGVSSKDALAQKLQNIVD